jgi:signal transduction histidine kinase
MYFSSIAHELRTPLNCILPLIDKLKTYIVIEKGIKYCNIIKNSALHLQSLINDTLDLSRFENNNFELNNDVFDIIDTVKEVVDILEFQI